MMFADMGCWGSHAIVIGDRGLDNGVVGTKCRRTGEAGSGDQRDRRPAQGKAGSLITPTPPFAFIKAPRATALGAFIWLQP